MKFIILFLSYMLFFIIGAVWMQIKETKFGIKSNFDCLNCEAIGCQFKWCSSHSKGVFK